MRRNYVFAAAVSACLALAGFGHAQVTQPKSNPGSIYDQTSANPYIDRVAHGVGDLVSVIVDEKAISNYTATTATNKTATSSTSVDLLAFINSIFKPFSTNSAHSSTGGGNTVNSSSMTARLTAVVKAVDPAGNFQIEARRTLATNKDTQTLVLSGVIRPADIQPDNTIESTKIAEAKIGMDGKGTIAERQRKGFLTKVLDWLF